MATHFIIEMIDNIISVNFARSVLYGRVAIEVGEYMSLYINNKYKFINKLINKFI